MYINKRLTLSDAWQEGMMNLVIKQELWWKGGSVAGRHLVQTSSFTWCFSDRASWIDYILITNFDALIIIYS